MRPSLPARWYFDLVSPFAYLHLKRFGELHPALDVELVPVLFASGEMRRVAEIGVGAARKEVR